MSPMISAITSFERSYVEIDAARAQVVRARARRLELHHARRTPASALPAMSSSSLTPNARRSSAGR